MIATEFLPSVANSLGNDQTNANVLIHAYRPDHCYQPTCHVFSLILNEVSILLESLKRGLLYWVDFVQSNACR